MYVNEKENKTLNEMIEKFINLASILIFEVFRLSIKCIQFYKVISSFKNHLKIEAVICL